jgi:hypothetical protein
VGLPCRVRVNYRGYAVAVHRRLCYPHVTCLSCCCLPLLENSDANTAPLMCSSKTNLRCDG